jgi:FdhD protein
VRRSSGQRQLDTVVVEEALEIRVDGQPLAVTMRTPGHDRELVAGFLFTEGVITRPEDLAAVERGSDPASSQAEQVIFARLRATARVDRARFKKAQREFRAVAACGLCGKGRLEDLYQDLPAIEPLAVDGDFLAGLPERMRDSQTLFEQTGGIHAAAHFDREGRLLCLREDIGRHNAIDKVIGHYILAGTMPLAGRILVSSGRAGFEIVQKALMASVPVLVSVGAASSLAVGMAKESGMALYTFVSGERWNQHE